MVNRKVNGIMQYDLEYFEKVLRDLFQGEKRWEMKVENGEWVAILPTSYPKAQIVIRSSISPHNMMSRGNGKDSIRITLRNKHDKDDHRDVYLFKSDRWTTRVEGWENRLCEKIVELNKMCRGWRNVGKCKCGDWAMPFLSKTLKNPNRIFCSCDRCNHWEWLT